MAQRMPLLGWVFVMIVKSLGPWRPQAERALSEAEIAIAEIKKHQGEEPRDRLLLERTARYGQAAASFALILYIVAMTGAGEHTSLVISLWLAAASLATGTAGAVFFEISIGEVEPEFHRIAMRHISNHLAWPGQLTLAIAVAFYIAHVSLVAVAIYLAAASYAVFQYIYALRAYAILLSLRDGDTAQSPPEIQQ